jgi:hypothetical protein
MSDTSIPHLPQAAEAAETNLPTIQPPNPSPPVSSPNGVALRRIKRRRRSKPHARSKLDRLKPEQRVQVLSWMFDGNMSYREAAEKCEREFGVSVHHTAFGTFYRRELKHRQLVKICESTTHARDIVKQVGKGKEDIYGALLHLLAQAAFDASVNLQPGEKPDLSMVMEIVPLLKETREADRKFALERERWEIDVVMMCHTHFKELQAIIENEELDHPEMQDEMRTTLFGKPSV